MMNTMTINGYRAVIQYDPEIEMFRGEFIGLNGGAEYPLDCYDQPIVPADRKTHLTP